MHAFAVEVVSTNIMWFYCA